MPRLTEDLYGSSNDNDYDDDSKKVDDDLEEEDDDDDSEEEDDDSDEDEEDEEDEKNEIVNNNRFRVVNVLPKNKNDNTQENTNVNTQLSQENTNDNTQLSQENTNVSAPSNQTITAIADSLKNDIVSKNIASLEQTIKNTNIIALLKNLKYLEECVNKSSGNIKVILTKLNANAATNSNLLFNKLNYILRQQLTHDNYFELSSDVSSVKNKLDNVIDILTHINDNSMLGKIIIFLEDSQTNDKILEIEQIKRHIEQMVPSSSQQTGGKRKQPRKTKRRRKTKQQKRRKSMKKRH